jgi:phosphoserine phosphatase
VVFDNDGTLWSEKPLYFQFAFAIDMVRVHAAEHPEWEDEQPFKGILENDLEAVMASGNEGIGKMLAATHAGMRNEEFMQTVAAWIDTARHNQTGKLFRDMVFQPMLELLDYFRSNGFRTYIVSGGTVHFMRPWTYETYGIPPEQVIGSRFRMQFEMSGEGPVLIRESELDFLNDKEGKPVNIAQIIGKRPVAAFGNSDGDLAMMQYIAAGQGRRLIVYIHHTDAEREWAYDRDSHIGRLDKGLDEASKNGWVVVDMKDQWKIIYPEKK